VVGICGSIGLLVADVRPLSLNVAGLLEMFAIVILARPAPTFCGETLTAFGPRLAVSSIGAAARGLFGKLLDPQPAIAPMPTAMATAAIAPRPLLHPQAGARVLILAGNPRTSRRRFRCLRRR
jgi:hypothetical protein